ncbi:hypothetical protein N7495_007169 [Penicillium taxi]|uniref:uncharacterized protein n=1 Tax=Penicillium taxi TaxID=168475 RepID=UPI002544F977|nr:uncharacterized protein N7495_007169 [Penicillium taxi]KAJ5895478.1 hypothetical protein N7495_007169 [Penicillium taxi]
MSVRSERGRSPISPRDKIPLRSKSPDARHKNGTRSPSPARSRHISRTPSSHVRSRSPRSRSRSGQRYRGRSYSRSASPPQSAKIVVEKLTRNVTEEHLQEIFGAFGEILKIDLPMNRGCGSSCDTYEELDPNNIPSPVNTNKGTAYIIYREPADAEAAISHMHEGQLDGAVLSVAIILPRRRFSRTPPPSNRTVGRPRFALSPPRRQNRRTNDTYRPPSVSRSRSPRRSRSYYSRSPQTGTRRRSPSYDSRSRSPKRSRSRSSSLKRD